MNAIPKCFKIKKLANTRNEEDYTSPMSDGTFRVNRNGNGIGESRVNVYSTCHISQMKKTK